MLKEFFFARANIPGNGELRRGQLVMARRTNWVAGIHPLLIEGGAPLVVTDHYQYGGLGGQVSRKTTSISLPSGGQSFSSEYTYGLLGDIATLDYPSGNWPYESAPQRSVSYSRRLGFLTAIPGYATSINYQLGGMLHEIQYPNGARWRQTAEAATGWERPDKIETFAGSTLLWSTGDYGYDGAGNISAIGARDYVYDVFSRFAYVRNNGATPNEQQASYDAYGNLTSLAKSGSTRALTTNPAANRLAIGGASYTSNGEIAAATIDGAAFAYHYDGLGQQLFQQSATKTWLHIYDANDERVMTWECAQNLCGEETSFERYTLRGLGGELLRSFEGRNRGSLEWKEDYVYRDGQPLAWIQAPAEGAGEIYQYLHADPLGSSRLVTSATGAQVSRHDFLPFTVLFGRTTPIENYDTGKRIGVTVKIDAAAVQEFHFDKSGVVTTAHEVYHVDDYRRGKSLRDVENGDVPTSATGPAENFGKLVSGQKNDMTPEESADSSKTS